MSQMHFLDLANLKKKLQSVSCKWCTSVLYLTFAHTCMRMVFFGRKCKISTKNINQEDILLLKYLTVVFHTTFHTTLAINEEDETENVS